MNVLEIYVFEFNKVIKIIKTKFIWYLKKNNL